MAGIRLNPPEQFDFSKPDEWPKWKKRFEQYRSASGLKAEEDPRQVDTLLYCMGEEADSVLASTHISAEDRKKYDAVVGKFDAYFKVRRNTIFERARFNRRSQREGESAEQYITELYELIEFCEYGELKEEMLRDQLVVGIQDLTLSERLQTDPELTLEKVKTMIRQKAAAKEHRRELQGDNEAALNRLRRGNGPRTSSGNKAGPVVLHRSITDRITTKEEPTGRGPMKNIVRGVVVTNISLETGVQLWE